MKTYFSLILLLLNTLCLMAQQSAEKFFPKKELMQVGAYYYPEHWDEAEWEADIKKMASLGFKFTHFAEFAWARLEPEEGKYDFKWLDKAMTLADKYGLKVIMCTPSPCIPAWLAQKHPEVLVMGENGRRFNHNGARLTGSISSQVYKDYVAKITAEMARHYANDKRIIGWQVGNEPHIEGHFDYSPASEAAFKEWLKNKYQTIANLNKVWGASFWSFTFNSFDQINIPNKTISGSNPHAFLDFQLFTADEVAGDLRNQAAILRKTVTPSHWITTNYAYYKFLPEVNPFLNRKDFDFSSYTMYLLSTWLDAPKGNLAHRLGSGLEMAYSNHLTKSVQGYTGIMELQPGQINWGAWNSQPLPGAVKMWMWHNYGMDAKFICTYRYRQPAFGGEQYHKAITETDGQTVSPGGAEYVEFIKELESIKKDLKPGAPMPASLKAGSAAILWKQANILETEISKHTLQWNYFSHIYKYFSALKAAGVPVTFLTEADEWNPQTHPVMIAPAYALLDETIVKRWKEYAEKGGHLVLSCRSGQKDNNGILWHGLTGKPIHDLIGAKIEFFDQLPPNIEGKIKSAAGENYGWSVWADVLIPENNTQVLASYDSEFYKGKAAVVTRKIGKGQVTYIGADSKDGALEKSMIQKVYALNNTPVMNLPDYFFVDYRDGVWVAVNYTSDTVNAPVPDKAKILLGEKAVAPGKYVIWKD